MVNLTNYEKGSYIAGIKVFNNLSQSIKIVADNEKSFKVSLKKVSMSSCRNIINTWKTN
jgi:hypothetical protein